MDGHWSVGISIVVAGAEAIVDVVAVTKTLCCCMVVVVAVEVVGVVAEAVVTSVDNALAVVVVANGFNDSWPWRSAV